MRSECGDEVIAAGKNQPPKPLTPLPALMTSHQGVSDWLCRSQSISMTAAGCVWGLDRCEADAVGAGGLFA